MLEGNTETIWMVCLSSMWGPPSRCPWPGGQLDGQEGWVSFLEERAAERGSRWALLPAPQQDCRLLHYAQLRDCLASAPSPPPAPVSLPHPASFPSTSSVSIGDLKLSDFVNWDLLPQSCCLESTLAHSLHRIPSAGWRTWYLPRHSIRTIKCIPWDSTQRPYMVACTIF